MKNSNLELFYFSFGKVEKRRVKKLVLQVIRYGVFFQMVDKIHCHFFNDIVPDTHIIGTDLVIMGAACVINFSLNGPVNIINPDIGGIFTKGKSPGWPSRRGQDPVFNEPLKHFAGQMPG